MADKTADFTLKGVIKGQGGLGIATVWGAATVDAADYFDMDTLLGEDVQVVNAYGQRDSAGTPVVEVLSFTLTSTTPDRITIGAGADNKTREITVFFTGRSSTGGSA